jgi:hypothetical protein
LAITRCWWFRIQCFPFRCWNSSHGYVLWLKPAVIIEPERSAIPSPLGWHEFDGNIDKGPLEITYKLMKTYAILTDRLTMPLMLP